MKKLTLIAAFLASVGLGTLVPTVQAAAAPAGGKNFTCGNVGGGPQHTVNCQGSSNSGLITVAIVTPVTVSDNDLVLIANALNDVNVNLATTLVIQAIQVAINQVCASLAIPVEAIHTCCDTICG